MLASRWIPWAAALIGAALTITVWATRRERLVPMPPLPDPSVVPLLRLWYQPIPPPPPSGPMRAVPCLSGDHPSIHARADHPVICTDAACIAIDLDRHATTLTDRPTDAAALPMHATVASGDARLGPHLAKAVAAAGHADATLDRSTVLVGNEIWNVAADRTVAPHRPDYNPRGPEHSAEVIGDVLLVRWEGSCTDAMCLVSQLVDRKGRELGWIDATRRVLVIDDRFFLAIGEFSVFEVRDLHTGAQVSAFDPLLHEGDFLDIARLDTGRYALLRSAGLDVEVSVLEIEDGRIAFGDRMVLPSCE